MSHDVVLAIRCRSVRFIGNLLSPDAAELASHVRGLLHLLVSCPCVPIPNLAIPARAMAPNCRCWTRLRHGGLGSLLSCGSLFFCCAVVGHTVSLTNLPCWEADVVNSVDIGSSKSIIMLAELSVAAPMNETC